MEKEIIRFTVEVFSAAGTYGDSSGYILVWIYRWDGFNWIWDENKDTIEETLERYPLDKFCWVSL